VRVEGGVFTDRAIVMGKVYIDCECDSLAVVQGARTRSASRACA
jgi:hypothetical protein